MYSCSRALDSPAAALSCGKLFRPMRVILGRARRQVNAERRVTPERDAVEGILFDVFE